MVLQDYQSLFSHITGISERYKNINDITGENFNIFRILKMESAEVRMHSAFIGELLNPKGSHGQRDKFLQLFIEQFAFRDYIIDSSSCNVILEKHAGFLSEDKMQGGRFDIFIADKNDKHIIIENKIYAGDQDNQLIRYSNYSKDSNLLYLTLDGRLPNENSCGQLKIDEDYKCISYSENMIEWLELCRKETATLPILRESITQYINLIKYLTNQTLNHIMQEEISKAITMNMRASIMVADNLKHAQSKLLFDFGEALKSELLKRELTIHYDLTLNKRYNGFYVSKSNWQQLRIVFQFQAFDRNLYYGIATIQDPLKFPVSSSLRAAVEALPGNTEISNIWWPWIRIMEEPFDNWHNYEVWDALISDLMLNNVLKKIDDLMSKVALIDL